MIRTFVKAKYSNLTKQTCGTGDILMAERNLGAIGMRNGEGGGTGIVSL